MLDMPAQAAKVSLERIPLGADTETLMKILDRDGCVVIEGVLSAEQVAQVNREMDSAFKAAATANESAGKGDPAELKQFLGFQTKRVMHSVAKSKTYCNEFLGSPVIYSYAQALLKESTLDVSVMATQGIEIYPGQGAQVLHRDQQYPFLDKFGREQPCVLCNMMLALTDFTEEIGATRVVPGSHDWEDWTAQPTPEMAIAAEMKAGDVMFFNGKTFHGGGTNRTTDKVRRSISTGFTCSFMNFGGSEEAHPFAISLDQARQMPPQVQKMIGFRSPRMDESFSYGSWRVEMQNLEDYLKL